MQEQARQAGAEVRMPLDVAGVSPYHRIRAAIAGQDWLEPVAYAVQGVIGRAMETVGRPVTDVLHGTWLGHPLHVALTDVPIGAWTAAFGLDLLDMATARRRFSSGADAATALGLAAAVPTAVTGLADYKHLYGYPRRVGLLHAGLNVLAVILQAVSLGMRLSGRRKAGVALSTSGYMSMVTAAWLGGELVEEQGVGVDHSAFPAGPKEFTPVMTAAELPEGRLHKTRAGAVDVLLYKRDGDIYAIGETCSHQGGPLSEGKLENGVVTCPWHGSQFRVDDGRLVHGPSTFDQPRYEVRVVNGQIEVRQAPIGQ